MDIVLLILVILLALALIAVNIYLLMYYSHPDDHGFGISIWPKILVVLGLTLAFSQVLIIPLDASNSRGYGSGLRLDILWQVVLISVAAFSIVLAPFALFYYEADEDKSFCGRICYAIRMEFFLILILAALLTAGYFFLSEAQIPIKEVTLKFGKVETSDAAEDTNEVSISSGYQPDVTCTLFDSTMNMNVSIFIFIIGVFSWFGWCFSL
eukprot:TRINITY_DN5521_c0_g1_i16.p1 TRINITY_DN5521_c0_g1~~TRINITY_DN5521_c0_g1_i16.p1  ORF type:complete len:210 (+),score=40.34 TRINITY_DN5521_c0_g1_i16:103-732(+)